MDTNLSVPNIGINNNIIQESIINKIIFLQNIVQDVVKRNQIYKAMDLVEASDLNTCISYTELIFIKLRNALTLSKAPVFAETECLTQVQAIIGEISTLVCLYGCDTLDHLVSICIGVNFKIEEKYLAKYKLLNKYVHPTKYKILDWKKNNMKNKLEEYMVKNADIFDCFETDNMIDNFHNNVYGLKLVLHNIEKQHTILVYGVVDDMMIDLIDNEYLNEKIQFLKNSPPADPLFHIKSYTTFIECLTIKELLIHTPQEIQQNYSLAIEDYTTKINKKPLSELITAFMEQDLFTKRATLIRLLINNDKNETHYLAYLLYDLLSNDVNGIVDTYEQNLIYNSLPCNIKRQFHTAMKQTINYTNKLSRIDTTKIPLEQQICLMKTDESVKEKAMLKLKEIKMKAEDTGSKARQYLEGILKIPFGIYKEEPVLKLMSESIVLFNTLVNSLIAHEMILKCAIPIPFPIKLNTSYTSFEMQKYLPLIKNELTPMLRECITNQFNTVFASLSKSKLLELYEQLKKFLASISVYPEKISVAGKTIIQLRTQLLLILDDILKNADAKDAVYDFFEIVIFQYDSSSLKNDSIKGLPLLKPLTGNIQLIHEKQRDINLFMREVTTTLDKSVYGHKKAKRQLERIIGQWINGDLTGYCFGFEGPPGVGKTSLAKKGIAHCLKDAKGVSRPFSLIAMGGSSNSSTLDGHNYTYVGSSWGRIVDILMDTKIMNPIIFIDELDKVSKTENGKEIIGILTHLIDQTQNDSFQDKYFNGVNLNLSKALFIFSYNDVDSIDRILLDRIHRIKFEHLSLEDKLIITRNFILPEFYTKMGLTDMIEMSDEIIEYIIEEYTSEPGVRKLKEIIFEIIGEINLVVLKNDTAIMNALTIPIIVTKEDIKKKYLKERREINPMKIHAEASVGVINGLWANSVGKGGILPIEASFFPSGTFLDLKLTGMQGDVMKESMTVAKSLAWSVFLKMAASDNVIIPEFTKRLEETKTQGLHIHVPEGATPKDGPSAGTAITMVMYSLFSGRKIRNEVAITGEICLQGRVTAIGGLDLKIIGGLRAGVKLFIFPKDNEKDFNDFIQKYENKSIIQDIKFVAVERIEEVIPLIFI